MSLRKAINRGGSNSSKFGILGSDYDSATRAQTVPKLQKLSRAGQDRFRQAGAEELQARLRNMPREQLETFRELRDYSESGGDSPDPGADLGDMEVEDGPNLMNVQDILDGSAQLNISHAGGEFMAALQDELEQELSRGKRKSRPDYRVRDDRTQNLVNAWDVQMDRLVAAYMAWCAEADLGVSHQEETSAMVEKIKIHVVDLYETSNVAVELNADGAGVPAALIKQGLVPCSPWKPSVAIATRVLELYRTTHVRCLQLAIQAFVKSLCDLHGVPYRPHLREQFSIAYDVYLELRRKTDSLVNSKLGRDAPNWRLKHTCPACMYKLEGEDKLIFSMLTTMDGDQRQMALKRSQPWGRLVSGKILGKVGEDYFLTREQVDKWAKGRVADILPTDAKNPCSDRWKNMINDVTSRMWGIFDETGIFLALCRHGFVLVVADMIRSGELAKYPLAVVDALLEAFGLNIGGGYDIGCHFGTTIQNSELGDRARNNNFRSLVGSFHGHAHNRLCQLSFLATYVKGMGLEDLEGCERYFSRSNGLAKSVRYASKFHRQQDITTFMKQIDDLETYANLSKFICDNYRQALKIIKTEPELKRWMSVEGIEGYETFHEWLKEEQDYLQGMEDSLPKRREETLEMEYVKKLEKLEISQSKLQGILKAEKKAAADDADFSPASTSLVARRHAIEKRNQDSEVVQDLESKLGIKDRWTSASPQYQEALDSIERIIVERLLEMTKIHQSGTGYKMRSHIAKALQARSKAIRKAIDRYNLMAADMDPPST
ncbi:hypothetical protein MSAN_00963700 [Mycena sanguinolenta]|uniref:CxC1-like cysteine cluster associated with KDZ transposases domain-containing protein n=1 Tax=Mycena sanguinolenta TaxID=230812 RepID=A0A8H7DA89_9AGAR|nr:hypothetical protein MSAN_00963700 [Mycena sanguinolenta]